MIATKRIERPRHERPNLALLLPILLAMTIEMSSCNARINFDEKVCSTDLACPLATLHCDTRSATCVACTTDSHCVQLGTGLNRCDVALHRCIECGTDSDCGSGRICHASHCVTPCHGEGLNPVCPAATPRCEDDVAFCVFCEDATIGCIQAATGTICNRTTGLCVSCLSDANCGGTNPHCDVVTGRCVECLQSTDCPSTMPVCDPATTRCVAHP